MTNAKAYSLLVRFGVAAALLGLLIVISFYFKLSNERRAVKEGVDSYPGQGAARLLGNGLLDTGFAIEFAPFDLSQPYKATYEIGKLPPLRGTGRVELITFCDDTTANAMKEGSLAITLALENGQKILSCSAPLSEWWYDKIIYAVGTLPERRVSFSQGALSSDFSQKDVAGHQHLRVTIDYQSGTNVPSGSTARVTIRSGGHM